MWKIGAFYYLEIPFNFLWIFSLFQRIEEKTCSHRIADKPKFIFTRKVTRILFFRLRFTFHLKIISFSPNLSHHHFSFVILIALFAQHSMSMKCFYCTFCFRHRVLMAASVQCGIRVVFFAPSIR